jgi:tetratricopeptide (TPR) repeat protein
MLYLHQSDLAYAYLDSAMVIMESIVAADPDIAINQSNLGKIYAALDRKDEAIAAAQRGILLEPINTDALDGPNRMWDLATVYADLGEADLAIDQLDSLLSIPSEVSVTWLRMAPEYISLHDHPGFEKLIEKYETKHEI